MKTSIDLRQILAGYPALRVVKIVEIAEARECEMVIGPKENIVWVQVWILANEEEAGERFKRVYYSVSAGQKRAQLGIGDEEATFTGTGDKFLIRVKNVVFNLYGPIGEAPHVRPLAIHIAKEIRRLSHAD